MKLGVIALVMGLVMVFGVIAATEQTAIASVTVNELISITIATCTGGLNFGSLNPGTTDNPITCQGAGTAAVTVTNDAVSNVNINVQVKGDNFISGANTITVDNVEFDESNAKPSPITLSASYQTSTSNVAPGSTAGVWYWLDIPSGKAAGAYSSTFYFQGIKTP